MGADVTLPQLPRFHGPSRPSDKWSSLFYQELRWVSPIRHSGRIRAGGHTSLSKGK